jgi:hypothetical protein
VVFCTLKEQGLHPYHVQRMQALHPLQPNDYIRRQEFCDWVIQMCVDQPDFLRIVLFIDEAGFTCTEILIVTTLIFGSTNPGGCSTGSGRSTSKVTTVY